MALDDYIYCSPFLSVLSLDQLLEAPGDDGRAFDIPDPHPSSEDVLDREHAYEVLHGASMTSRRASGW